MKKNTVISFISVLLLGIFMFYPLKPTKNQAVTADSARWTEGKAECVMEYESRRILYASHADTRLPMASTTKILTAITVIGECKNLEENLVIPTEASGIEGSSVYLQAGESYSVKDLLYGLMLRSGNDCATALALRFGKTVEGFTSKMNLKAQAAGALNSNFVNPHGLPQDGHYTTAKDLSLITCYALHDPIFSEIVSTRYYESRKWQNKNKMLTRYEGAIGVKTGYTKQAGRCLVSAAKRDNMTLVCTVLGCNTTYERSEALLNDAFATYKNTALIQKGEVLSVGKTHGKAEESFYYPLAEGEETLVEIKTIPINAKKTQKIVGQFEIYLAKQLLFSGNLYKL